MARTALDNLLLGDCGELQSGDEIPEEFTVGGVTHKTDFERLEDLGLVKPVKGKAKASEPDES
jgi:hypothetical protein